MAAKPPAVTFKVDAHGLEAMLRVAAEHYAAGNLKRAHEVLKGLVKLNPRDARPFKLLGSLLFLQESHAPAEAAYARALELDPQDPYVLVALVELKLIMVKVSEAMEMVRWLRAIDPTGAHPASGRARFLLDHHLSRLGG